MPRANVTPEQYRAIVRRGGGRCAACGRRKDLQLDHIIPRNSGGTDNPENLALLCGLCNKRKGDRTISYQGWRGMLPLRVYRRLNTMGLPMKTIVLFCMRGAVVVVLALAVLFVLPVAHPIQLAMLGWITSVVVFVQSVAWLGIAGVVIIAATWAYSNMQMEAPDEYGQWRLPRSYLRKHPEIALQTNQQHQQIRIVQARYQVPHHYAPKFAPAVEPAQLEAAPPALPQLISLADVRGRTPAGALAFGVLPGGALLSAPPSDCYHVLFHGETRSGKTNAIDGVITQLHHLAAAGMPLTLYAGDKKGEFAATWQTSELFPDGIHTETAEIADMLDGSVHDPTLGLLARNKQFARAASGTGRIIRHIDDYEHATGERLPRVFVFVDEINSLLLDARRDDRLETVLMQALQMGASAGFYILGGAQHLTAQTFGTEGRNQFVTRAHFGAYNQGAIGMLFGKVDHDALRLSLDGTRGRGLIKTVGSGTPVPFQALRCDEQDILEAIQMGARRVTAKDSALETPINEINVINTTPKTPQNDTAERVYNVDPVAAATTLGATPQERDKILLLARTAKQEGMKLSRRAITRSVYNGQETGPPFQKVKAVLDEAGL